MDALATSSQPDTDPDSALAGQSLRPVLDDALSNLSEQDRDALLLRFLKNENLAAVGRAFGISEDAAQKRVSRALDKLRALLAQRGITTTAAALSISLAANAIQTLPDGAALTWTSAALASASIPASGAMAFSGLKTVLIAALTGGVIVLAVLNAHSFRRINALNTALESQAKELAAFRAASQPTAAPAASGDSSHLREIARLRARIDHLKTDLDAANTRLATAKPPASESSTNPPSPQQISIDCLCLTMPASTSDVLQSGTPESIAARFTNHPDVNLIALPRVTTLEGRQVHIASEQTVPFGHTTTNVGLALDIIPQTLPSGAINLQVSHRVARLNPQSIFEQRTGSPSGSVKDGSTFMFETVLGEGPWFDGDPTNSTESRVLVVVLTPTLIDATGNRLHLPTAQASNASSSDTSPSPQ